jgi:hypothetical protein
MGGVVSDLLLSKVSVSVSINDVHAAAVVVCIGVVVVETRGRRGTSEIGGEELSLIEGRSV